VIDMEERATLRDHLAAERTFLSWVRTGLALMGFGFLVARFAQSDARLLAAWFGSGIVLLGTAVVLGSALEYRRDRKQFEEQGGRRLLAGRLAGALTAALVLIGAVMAAYLVLFIV
jgi:putative membrane protein